MDIVSYIQNILLVFAAEMKKKLINLKIKD